MPILSDSLLAILRRMQAGRWMMARQIGATSAQYAWLIRHGYIVRRDADTYGTAHRWEYMLTVTGSQEARAPTEGGR